MIYTINIKYITGDSFGSSETEDNIGPVWSDLTKAKLALSYIKEHHKTVSAYEQLRTKSDMDSFVYSLKGKPWFIDKYWEHGLLLELDNGSKINTSCFWIGYFETLISAEIVPVEEEDSDMKYIPYHEV